MFVRKVMRSNRWRQLGEVYTWLAFISVVLVLANGVTSLYKVYNYSFQPLSVLLTYGWILFCALIEALGLSVVVELMIILVEHFLKLDLTFPVRILLLAGLILTLILIVAFIFVL